MLFSNVCSLFMLVPRAGHTDESRLNTPHAKDKTEENATTGGQDWSILWSCFENPLSLLSTSSGLPKGMRDMVCNAVSEMRRYYSRKVIDVLIKVTKATLDMLRRRFIQEDDVDDMRLTGGALTKPNKPKPKSPVFLLNSTLMIPNVSIRPSIDDLQEALTTAGKNITGIAKGVAQWSSGKEQSHGQSRVPRRNETNDKKARRRKLYCLQSEERPQMPHMTRSFYSFIMDNKEIVKMLNLLATCTRSIKPEIQTFIKSWKPYHFLWKNDRSTRELMEYGLLEFESSLRCLAELDANLLVEADMAFIGSSIAISTEKLKFGLAIEIKGIFFLLIIMALAWVRIFVAER